MEVQRWNSTPSWGKAWRFCFKPLIENHCTTCIILYVMPLQQLHIPASSPTWFASTVPVDVSRFDVRILGILIVTMGMATATGAPKHWRETFCRDITSLLTFTNTSFGHPGWSWAVGMLLLLLMMMMMMMMMDEWWMSDGWWMTMTMNEWCIVIVFVCFLRPFQKKHPQQQQQYTRRPSVGRRYPSNNPLKAQQLNIQFGMMNFRVVSESLILHRDMVFNALTSFGTTKSAFPTKQRVSGAKRIHQFAHTHTNS